MRVTSFQENLKQSKREQFSKLPDLLSSKVALVAKRFKDSDLQLACIDESITNRTEFSLDVSSNRKLAYLGDAFLSYDLARRAFERDMSPEDAQTWRAARTSDKHLATVYDRIFGTEDVVLHFNDVLSVKQKATFIEALLGLLQSQELVELIIKD